jgi:hypothetical protein
MTLAHPPRQTRWCNVTCGSYVSFSVASRLFSEMEVSEILKRASSSRTRQELSDADGISLEELQKVGSELGFDPRHIALAAQELGTTAPSQRGILSGRSILDQTVEGAVSAEDWLGMVAAIQRYHKSSGAVTQRGANYDWTGSDDEGSLAVTVMVRNGRTRIRVESNRWLLPFMAAVFCTVFAFVFSSAMMKQGSPIAVVPICGFFAALLFGLVRMFRQHHLQTISGLMDRLVNEVQSGGGVLDAFTPMAETDSEQTVRS